MHLFEIVKAFTLSHTHTHTHTTVTFDQFNMSLLNKSALLFNLTDIKLLKSSVLSCIITCNKIEK